MTSAETIGSGDGSGPLSRRVRRHKDGAVLLSLVDDRICKLNGVGALTWMVLEEAETNLNQYQVVDRLARQLEAISSEGEYKYEVSFEQLRSDTIAFLQKLVAMNLLLIIPDKSGFDSYRIKDHVRGTTSISAAEVDSSISVPSGSPGSTAIRKVSKLETLSAFIGLFAFDALLKFAGLRALIERVRDWPIAEPRSADLEIARHVRSMVDRAQMYYPRKAMCLQHSSVVTCLLRRRGIPAQMILAAQEFPVRVHAWSEVDGYVVNDEQSVKTKHREIQRI